MAPLGPVPLRSRVGNGARGLQRERRRVGLPASRSRALEGVPLGRGRHRRVLRSLPAPLLLARALEREGSDPEGALLRRRALRGQPRRGREGALLLRRRAAEPRVPAPPLQVSAGGVSVSAARRGEPGASRARPRGRADRHRRARRGPLLRRRGRDREGGRGRHRHRDHGAQPRARSRAAPSRPAALVPQRLGVGRHGAREAEHHARRRLPPRRRLGDAAAPERARRHAPRAVPPLPAGGRRAALHRQRDEHAAPLRRARRAAQPAREGRVPPRDRERRDGCREPGEARDEGVRALPLRGRAAGERLARAASRAGRRGHAVAARCRPEHRRRAPRRGGRVLRRDPSAEGERGGAERPEAGVRRDAVVEAVVPLRRRRVVRRRSPGRAAARVAPHDPQPALASPQLDAHPLDARRMGVPVVRSVGPRLPRDHVRADRSRVREGAAVAPPLRAVPAPERPDPGVRVGVLRPQPPGARLVGLARLQHGPHPPRKAGEKRRPRLP